MTQCEWEGAGSCTLLSRRWRTILKSVSKGFLFRVGLLKAACSIPTVSSRFQGQNNWRRRIQVSYGTSRLAAQGYLMSSFLKSQCSFSWLRSAVSQEGSGLALASVSEGTAGSLGSLHGVGPAGPHSATESCCGSGSGQTFPLRIMPREPQVLGTQGWRVICMQEKSQAVNCNS